MPFLPTTNASESNHDASSSSVPSLATVAIPASPPPSNQPANDPGAGHTNAPMPSRYPITIAVLALAGIFLALGVLVGLGLWRFGRGFLSGKRIPRKGLNVNGGVRAAGTKAGWKGRKVDKMGTVAEAPEEGKDGDGGDEKVEIDQRDFVDVELGRT